MKWMCIPALLFLIGVPLPVLAQAAPGALLARGRELERAGKMAEARRLYEEAAQKYPDQPAFHFKLGVFAMEQSEWSKAIAEFQACLRPFPRQVDSLLLLSQAYEKNGDVDRALETARRATGFHPDHAGACRLFGRYLCQAGKCGDGLQWLLKAHKISPDLPGIDYDIGITYEKLNDWMQSQSYLETAVERDPRNPQIRFVLAEVCKRTRDWEKARANYDAALTLGKRDAATYFGLGTALSTLGQYEAAVSALEQAYRLDPSLPAELHFQLGKALRALGRNDEAEREMTLRQRLTDVTSSGYRFTMAGDSAEQGLWNKVSGLLAQDREAEALAAIKAQAPNSNSLYLLGAGYFVLGRLPEAIRNVRAALAQQPALPDAHGYLAKILLAGGDLSGAEAEAESELGRDPQNQLGLATLGEIRFAQGRWADAAASIEASHTKDPGTLLRLCEAYFRIGRNADAEMTANVVRALARGDQELLAEVDQLVSRRRGR